MLLVQLIFQSIVVFTVVLLIYKGGDHVTWCTY